MPSIDATSEFAQQLGHQLRQAREAAGMSADAVCAQLKLHVGSVQALESGNWERLGAPVYVRGQLRSYAHLLGVSLSGADEHIARLQQRISARPAGYMLQVPVLPQKRVSKLWPLLLYGLGGALLTAAGWALVHWYLADADPVAASFGIPQVVAPAPVPLTVQPATSAPQADTLPMDTPVATAAVPVPVQTAADAAALTLRAHGDSWLELYTADRRVLEQTLLRAGDIRRFGRGQVGRVVIGNAAGVEVLVDGAVQDITPFQRANVARFAVSSDGVIVRTPN